MIKKALKIILKVVGGFLLLLLIIALVTYLFVNEPKPSGVSGDRAEKLADEMFAALNKPAYDTLKYVEFVFKGIHRYKWNKRNNQVFVSWGENEVFLDLNLNAGSYNEIETTAYEYFINDSFWLVAPFKVRDDGVIRFTLDVEKGRGLLVTYTSGGITPGDSYLWIIDENGFPKAWKLWTSNVPVGGLEFSWEKWEELGNVYFSTLHKNSVLDLDISALVVR
ncbi:MAG: hypothetical protein GDA37_10270 [Ekhidna sp.]|nr:hypothetical protein [Ekhidna sp.]